MKAALSSDRLEIELTAPMDEKRKPVVLTVALRRADRTLRKMKRCEEKIRYGTAAGAKWSLWGNWLDRYLRGRRRRRERRAYACPHCGGWHLTSQPKRRR
jgi:hypothetical protein